MIQLREPAYVEAFDALDFPSLEVRRSWHRERVVLIFGSVAAPVSGEPDGEGYRVISGHARVAEAMIEIALDDNPRLGESDLLGWIAETRQAEDEEQGWRQRWHAELALRPALSRAFAKGRDDLYERAQLTVPQILAMRLIYGEQPMAQREAAVALGISQPALWERLDAATLKLRTLES